MTQIIKLLDLAPDIQEQILFLPHLKGLNERNLRPIVRRIDWNEQRTIFQKIVSVLRGGEKIEVFNPRCYCGSVTIWVFRCPFLKCPSIGMTSAGEGFSSVHRVEISSAYRLEPMVMISR
jgi:hypothetical protein